MTWWPASIVNEFLSTDLSYNQQKKHVREVVLLMSFHLRSQYYNTHLIDSLKS